MKSVFTIDVEDWFHILDIDSSPSMAEWDFMPSRVETNFLRLLDLLSESGGQCTCFFLGWVANKYPQLVKEARKRGHEIASHGYEHRLVYSMTATEFREDILKARDIIEQIAGINVLGYRAPGFSVTKATPWFYDELLAGGYSYDASVFPATRGHGGMKDAYRLPQAVATTNDGRTLIEFPQSVVSLLGRRVCFFGGGYLRLAPCSIIRAMGKRVADQGGPLIFYIHPRDIDPYQPRLAMSAGRRFKAYVNLRSTEEKLRFVLRHFSMMSFQALLAGERAAIPDIPVTRSAAVGRT
jgi:polysaccharide deacetylase family protein (PEP-CTERM system associated)